MMVTPTEHCHVERVEGILGGEPVIKGTRTPVRAIAEYWRMGLTAEEIHERLPHLSMAQVFDGLSYFCDHSDEIMRQIEENHISKELLDPLVRDL